MKLLLDTHSFLWTLLDQKKLSLKARELITNPENSVWVSVISFWEISLKFSIGKLKLKATSPEQFPALAKKMGFSILELSDLVSSSFHQLPRLKHKDPFDRMLIWQAIQENSGFVSKDKEIKKYERLGLKLFW